MVIFSVFTYPSRGGVAKQDEEIDMKKEVPDCDFTLVEGVLIVGCLIGIVCGFYWLFSYLAGG